MAGRDLAEQFIDGRLIPSDPVVQRLLAAFDAAREDRAVRIAVLSDYLTSRRVALAA